MFTCLPFQIQPSDISGSLSFRGVSPTESDHTRSKVLEVRNPEGDAFEHSNLAVHAFDEAAGDAMMEEIDDPVMQFLS